MQIEAKLTPDYLFETSWEVCNKVGGIYTVLSTRANTLQQLYKDRVLFIGPDLQGDKNPWFIEEPDLYKSWREHRGLTAASKYAPAVGTCQGTSSPPRTV